MSISETERDDHMIRTEPVDLAAAQRWTRQRLIEHIRTTEHQINLEGR